MWSIGPPPARTSRTERTDITLPRPQHAALQAQGSSTSGARAGEGVGTPRGASTGRQGGECPEEPEGEGGILGRKNNPATIAMTSAASTAVASDAPPRSSWARNLFGARMKPHPRPREEGENASRAGPPSPQDLKVGVMDDRILQQHGIVVNVVRVDAELLRPHPGQRVVHPRWNAPSHSACREATFSAAMPLLAAGSSIEAAPSSRPARRPRSPPPPRRAGSELDSPGENRPQEHRAQGNQCPWPARRHRQHRGEDHRDAGDPTLRQRLSTKIRYAASGSTVAMRKAKSLGSPIGPLARSVCPHELDERDESRGGDREHRARSIWATPPLPHEVDDQEEERGEQES